MRIGLFFIALGYLGAACSLYYGVDISGEVTDLYNSAMTAFDSAMTAFDTLNSALGSN